MDAILDKLLAGPATPTPMPDIDSWWRAHQLAGAGLEHSLHRAMAGAFVADRPAYAFASGYHEALEHLIPGAGQGRMCLCATEEHGAHPRAIRTRLEPDGAGFRLHGTKQWATLGTHAHAYLVIAGEGQDAHGRNRLVAVRVPADRPGITAERLPDAGIVPELPHARLRFDAVHVEPGERLDGDGYERYLKPFRTVEDCHVYAALLAWVVQVGRRAAWPHDIIEPLIALLASASSIAAADPASPSVHVALAGMIALARTAIERAEPLWSAVDDDTRARWQRDRALLDVAASARARRREVAWQRLAAPRP